MKESIADGTREKRRWSSHLIRLVTRFEPIRRVLFKYCEKRYIHVAPSIRLTINMEKEPADFYPDPFFGLAILFDRRPSFAILQSSHALYAEL